MTTPFTRKFVIGVTIDHQIRAVEFSLQKTLARSSASGISDEDNTEIVLTIQDLIRRRQVLLQERSALA